MLLKRKNRNSLKSTLNYVFFCVFSLCILCSGLPNGIAAGTSVNWTDETISPNTPIRAVHVQEMRNAINAKRISANMTVFVFTDPVLTPGVTRVRAKHFLELEQAIQQFYEHDPLWKPWFITHFQTRLYEINPYISTDGGHVSTQNLGPVHKPIKLSNVSALRTAITMAGFCGDSVCQISPNGPEGCGLCDVDCNTPCNTSISTCGAAACGSAGTCSNLEKCETTTCFCSTSYACIPDAACAPTGCTATNVPAAGGCGAVTLPAVNNGNVSSIACSGCAGTVSATCSSGSFSGINFGCVVPSCTDGIQNGTETGIDCGGSCAACAPTCSDGIRNGSETGVDCGGSCSACAPTCSDGIRNGSETGVDCGGSCPACGCSCLNYYMGCATTCPCIANDYDICTNDLDCCNARCRFNTCLNVCLNAGDYCDSDIDCCDGNCTGGVCQAYPPECNDGIRNNGEAGVDCGGLCPPCGGTCSDSLQNNGEEGVDCGGPCAACSSCAATALSNCQLTLSAHGVNSGTCSASGSCSYICTNGTWTLNFNSCAGATCSDGIRNGSETGVDCGGSCAACAPPTCSDGIQNGSETGTDCGGSCAACGANDCLAYSIPDPGGMCGTVNMPYVPEGGIMTIPCPGGCSGTIYGECQNGIVGSMVYGCYNCSDGIMNGSETGVDCGGTFCPACPTCSDGIRNGSETGVDCGGSCAACAPTCSDGIRNGTETGVDCGGSCAACSASTCSDGIKNGSESGIDCGGSCSACDCPAEPVFIATPCGGNMTFPGGQDGALVSLPCGGNCSGFVQADCWGGIYHAWYFGCLPLPCYNGIKDGTETGIDCGGSCAACASTCSDGIRNGSETGVDCGGSCSACAPTCSDGIRNGSETGVDCGGSCPACISPPTCGPTYIAVQNLPGGPHTFDLEDCDYAAAPLTNCTVPLQGDVMQCCQINNGDGTGYNCVKYMCNNCI